MASMTVRLIATSGTLGNTLEEHNATLRTLENVVQPRTCATCVFAKFSDDMSKLTCEHVRAEAPAWCIAFGCDKHDYLPF